MSYVAGTSVQPGAIRGMQEILERLQRERQIPTPVFLDPEHADTSDVYSLGCYYPRRRGNNPRNDAHSKRALAAKKGDLPAIVHFLVELDELLDTGFAVCAVPPSDPDSCSGIRVIAKALTLSDAGRVDATSCLVRQYKIPSAARNRRPRDIETHFQSIAVEDAELIQGRSVLLLDDIYTTGNTINACREMLTDAGAASVKGAVLGHTTR